MDISAKQEGWIESGVAIGTGILAWENAATSKYAAYWKGKAGFSLFDKFRFETALAGLIGNGAVKKIDPTYTGAADMQPNIFGAVNKTSVSGAIILIADAVARELIPEYKKLDGVPSVVRGAGMGITAGGIIGGIFDPSPRALTSQPLGQSADAQGNQTRIPQVPQTEFTYAG